LHVLSLFCPPCLALRPRCGPHAGCGSPWCCAVALGCVLQCLVRPVGGRLLSFFISCYTGCALYTVLDLSPLPLPPVCSVCMLTLHRCSLHVTFAFCRFLSTSITSGFSLSRWVSCVVTLIGLLWGGSCESCVTLDSCAVCCIAVCPVSLFVVAFRSVCPLDFPSCA
jgi:hypothetical protein